MLASLAAGFSILDRTLSFGTHHTISCAHIVTVSHSHGRAMLILYRHPENGLTPPTNITASMAKYAKTGVDLHTNWTLDFPNIGSGARASLSTSIGLNSPKDVVTRIQGTKGYVHILSMSIVVRVDLNGVPYV